MTDVANDYWRGVIESEERVERLCRARIDAAKAELAAAIAEAAAESGLPVYGRRQEDLVGTGYTTWDSVFR